MRATKKRPNWATVFSCVLMIVCVQVFTSCTTNPQKGIFQHGLENIPNQTFLIDNEQGAILRGNSGSILLIPQGAFTDEYGNLVTGQVEINLKEARDLVTMFHSGLQTLSEKGLLSTDGSYEITAFQDEKPVKVNPSTGFYAYFPTDQKDPDMGLYSGIMINGDVKWTLTGQDEQSLDYCNRNEGNRKKCKGCKYLLKMAEKGSLNQKPSESEYWAKRHYWENGILYYYSSGSRVPVMSKDRLEDCRDFLSQSEKGQSLLATIDQITRDQLSNAGQFYSYKLSSLGWYNIDKLVKDELISFTGRILDEKGQPAIGATVHLYSKARKIHVLQAANDGSYTFQYTKGEPVMLYAFTGNQVGKANITSPWEDLQTVPDLSLNEIDEHRIDAFLSDLM